VRSLRSCVPLAYYDNEHAKQLIYVLDDHMWCIKITALEECTDFAIIDAEKLFSKVKSHELSRKNHPNYDTSLTSKALITSACIGGCNANFTNTTVSYVLEFTLSSLNTSSDEQYKSIPDNEIALLVRKFFVLHKFRKERRRSPKGCFECGDTTHFIVVFSKRKKIGSSNKYDYIKRNDYNKGDNKKKHRFGDMKKKFQKIIS
jgi:hypothetical protein